jgi:hypothetical protein
MEKLKFLNQERLKIVHTCLIIRVQSINEIFGISVRDFVEKFNLWGVSNGKILLMADMMYPSEELGRVVSDILDVNGFIREIDWAVSYERNCYYEPYESGYLFKEIPELEEITWLESIMLEDGNWIWYKEENQTKAGNDEIFNQFQS